MVRRDLLQWCNWVEQIGSVPVPQASQPLQVGSAVLLASDATAASLLKVVNQQAMGQIGGQEESWVGWVEGPVSSNQAGQCGGVSITEQLQTVAMQIVQVGQLEESLGGEWSISD